MITNYMGSRQMTEN